MKGLGRYDRTLQMFVQTPQDVDAQRLRFLRWLAERGQLEHDVAGPPSGRYASTAPSAPLRASPEATGSVRRLKRLTGAVTRYAPWLAVVLAAMNIVMALWGAGQYVPAVLAFVFTLGGLAACVGMMDFLMGPGPHRRAVSRPPAP